jgi:hypothetical protein
MCIMCTNSYNTCMYIYMHIYICIYARLHVYLYHIHTFIIYFFIDVYVNTYFHTQPDSYTHLEIYLYSYVYVYIHIYKYVHFLSNICTLYMYTYLIDRHNELLASIRWSTNSRAGCRTSLLPQPTEGSSRHKNISTEIGY